MVLVGFLETAFKGFVILGKLDNKIGVCVNICDNFLVFRSGDKDDKKKAFFDTQNTPWATKLNLENNRIVP